MATMPVLKRLRLPYPTVVVFERAIALLGALRPGDYLDRGLLLGHGFAANAVNPLLEAFRFLRLTDHAGFVLASFAEFRDAGGPLIERALEPVLARLTPPYASRKALALALRPALDMTPSTVPLAATFVIWLAERAGHPLLVREGPSPGARPGVPRPARGAGARGGAASREVSARAPARDDESAGVTFQILVDRKTTREDLERMLREVAEARARLGGSGLG